MFPSSNEEADPIADDEGGDDSENEGGVADDNSENENIDEPDSEEEDPVNAPTLVLGGGDDVANIKDLPESPKIKEEGDESGESEGEGGESEGEGEGEIKGESSDSDPEPNVASGSNGVAHVGHTCLRFGQGMFCDGRNCPSCEQANTVTPPPKRRCLEEPRTSKKIELIKRLRKVDENGNSDAAWHLWIGMEKKVPPYTSHKVLMLLVEIKII